MDYNSRISQWMEHGKSVNKIIQEIKEKNPDKSMFFTVIKDKQGKLHLIAEAFDKDYFSREENKEGENTKNSNN